MKKDIHPEYKETTITCACGEIIQTGSTKENIHVEICSKCHPFFTGKQKLIDSAGRVEGFKKKYEKFNPNEVTKKNKKSRKKSEQKEEQIELKKEPAAVEA